MYDQNSLQKDYPEVEAIFEKNPILRENLMRYYRFSSMVRFACENALSIEPLPDSYFTQDQNTILDGQLYQDHYAAIIFVNNYINELGILYEKEEQSNIEDLDIKDFAAAFYSRRDKIFELGLSHLMDCHVADMVLKSKEMLDDAIKGALLAIREKFTSDED